MKILVLIVFLVMIGCLLAAAIAAMSPPEYTPMPPDEERKWLKETTSLTDEEIEEIIE